MTEKTVKKFVDFCREYCRLPEYDEKIRDLIFDIKNNNHNDDYYNGIIENYKNNFSILDAILDKNDTSSEIVEKIVNEFINGMPKEITKDFRVANSIENIVGRILCKEISPKMLDDLTRGYSYYIKEILSFNYFQEKADSTKVNIIPQKNIQSLCNSFLKRKSLRTIPSKTPFCFITDNDFALSVIHNSKADEIVFTAVAMNKNLSDKVRDEAFDLGVNYLDLDISKTGLTEHMINEIYESAVQTYTELELNPVTYYGKKEYSKDEIKAFEQCCDCLRSMVSRRLLNESLQNDLFNRIVYLNQKSGNYLLQELLTRTKSEYIFNNLSSVRNQSDLSYSVCRNEYIPENILNDKINEYFGIMEAKRKAVPTYILQFFDYLIGIRKLDDKILKTMCNLDLGCDDSIAISVYASQNVLNDIIQKHKNERDYSQKTLVYHALFNLIVKATDMSIDKQEFLLNNIIDLPFSNITIVNDKDKRNLDRIIKDTIIRNFSINYQENNPLTKEDKIKLREKIKEFNENCTDKSLKTYSNVIEKVFEYIDNKEADGIKDKDIELHKLKTKLFDNISCFSWKVNEKPSYFFTNIEQFAEECINTMNKIKELGDDVEKMKQIHDFLDFLDNENKIKKDKEDLEER